MAQFCLGFSEGVLGRRVWGRAASPPVPTR